MGEQNRARAIAVARDSKRTQAALFVSEYVLDFKPSAAYERCFPYLCDRLTRNEIATRANALLKDPWVAHEVERRRRETILPSHVTQERVLRELARIAFADPRKLDGKRLKDLDDDEAAIVKSWQIKGVGRDDEDGEALIDVEIKLHDKLSALQTLAKVTGLVKDVSARVVEETGALFDTADEAEIMAILDEHDESTGVDTVDMPPEDDVEAVIPDEFLDPTSEDL